MVISIFTLPQEGKTWAECKTGDICDCLTYEYEKHWNGAGTFTIELPISSRFRSMVEVNSVLVTDSGDALIVKNIQTTLDKVKITGYDLNGLLYDRLTMYSGDDPENDGSDECKGTTEYCVKHYVSYNLAACDKDAGRNLPRFGVTENLDRGDPDDSHMPRLQNVHDVVTEMCGAAGLGWRIYINENIFSGDTDSPIFLFDVAEQTDRSVNQSDRNRVIFSVQQHNVSEMTREVGITAAKNALYLDIDGTVQAYPQDGDNSGRAVAVGYARREEYCALTGKSLEPEEYRAEAEHNMADRMNETDSLTIEAGDPLEYGRLYDVGTVVTVYDRERSLQLDSVISSAEIRRSGTEYSVKLTLGDSKPKVLDQYQKKNESTTKTVRAENGVQLKKYISAKVANAQAVDYDSIERGLLSVDFTVDGTDSDVVFSANQLCDVGAAGTLNCIYKVDGATQDFKPLQTLTAGRHVLPHIYAMPLDKGKHNFAVYILSEDGGRGTTDIGWLTGALSGQISGLKNNAPPNENLVLYLSGFPDVPDGTEVTLPAYMYANKSAKKYVDWGDGSVVEESTDYVAVSHTYAAGDYIITIKSGNVSFGGSSMTTGTNFAEYLTRVYFPDGAADISWGNASKNFAALEAVTFGTSAASISWNFLNSTLITSVILPDTVTKLVLTNINKTAITALVIPEKVTSSLSLGACASLKTLEAYGSGSVGARLSTNLQKLTIGKNMDTIGSNGYDGCTGLSEIVFLTPSKLTKINISAFRGCSALGAVDLPSTVETIGENAFYGCSGLTSIVLPEKLTTLGKNAFNGCTGLTSVRVGSALTDIYYGAFSGCINLGSINFPDGLLTIGELAFYNTGAISPEFPSSLVTISTKAFQKSGITAAVLRANMTVGTYAFSESGLSELIIENGFAAISDYCFKDTASLESVSVPSSVTKIGAFAFNGSGLKTLHLSEGLETVGASAFRNSNLTSATLPDSVADVGDHAFTDCESMTGVTIKGNTTLGTYAFSSCGSLASADMGATANIPGYCFNGCKNLNSVSFAADTVVGGSAFAGCGFTSLSLAPFLMTSTLTDVGGMYSLGSGAFANCSNLASVDGLKYKWDVGLKTRTSYIDGDGNRQWNEWEDKGCVEQGIYDSMGATTDSVFNGTKLYNYTEYLKNNGLVNTDDIQYSVYHYTGRNPAYAT